MLTDVVTLFPAEFEIGDSVFDQTSHRWHEIVGVGSGDGQVMFTTHDGVDLSLPASELCTARLTAQRHDVALEHQHPLSTTEMVTDQFWD